MPMIPLDELERLQGFPSRATMRRWAEAGEIIAEQVYKGSRLVWRADVESVRARRDKKPHNSLEALLAQWDKEQANGIHTGRAIGKAAIESARYGLSKYWHYLGGEGGANDVTAANLQIALSNVPVDYEARNCHFGMREKMYRSVCSFLSFLGRHGYNTDTELLRAKRLKPKRIFPPRKTVLTEDQLKKLLMVNEGWKVSRRDVDTIMTQTILLLACYCGLRRSEIINLKLSHVLLDEAEIMVVDGKGHKDARVGMPPAVVRGIKAWLAVRPKVGSHLLVSKQGKPLDKRGVNRRVDRAAERAGLDVTLHGLRRTFATVHVKHGVPLPIVQKGLRHSDIKTTMQYVMIDERQAVDYFKGHAPKPSLAKGSRLT